MFIPNKKLYGVYLTLLPVKNLLSDCSDFIIYLLYLRNVGLLCLRHIYILFCGDYIFSINSYLLPPNVSYFVGQLYGVIGH